MTLLPLKTLKNPLKIEDKIIVSSKIFDRKCLKIVIYIFAFWKVCNTNITFNVQRKLLKCIYFIGVKFFSLFGQICFWLAVRWTKPIHNINNEIAISLFSFDLFLLSSTLRQKCLHNRWTIWHDDRFIFFDTLEILFVNLFTL